MFFSSWETAVLNVLHTQKETTANLLPSTQEENYWSHFSKAVLHFVLTLILISTFKKMKDLRRAILSSSGQLGVRIKAWGQRSSTADCSSMWMIQWYKEITDHMTQTHTRLKNRGHTHNSGLLYSVWWSFVVLFICKEVSQSYRIAWSHAVGFTAVCSFKGNGSHTRHCSFA